ncbi:putative E3 ubiquitin-protein ligase UBR7 [Orchesella cincta]|uniref:Putative E3 ubiquitin-protein ligase UBR7 n=1 Tax=Orchesella cincta TaxID=48709 RepID=A0A1D2NAR8_ORCCI|nr:putative E3 ubiquitin-protein ligase UBR7 [Orchesella cincta]
MDPGGQSPELSKPDKEGNSNLGPTGMEQGAGDAGAHGISMPSYSSMEKAYDEDMAAVQACLEGLRFPKSFQDLNTTGEKGNEGWESDENESVSTDTSSELEIQCSYPFGYLKRQTVYICVTCNDPSKEGWIPAGVCIGCRKACHQGHELISLETRRSFKCDCGNKKFPQGSPCLLWPEKEDANELNAYNGNYKGTFCTCKCKEDDCVVEDPLYQCVVCEDWYHAGHCNATTEGIEHNYTDLVCGGCTAKLDFLRYYEPFDPAVIVDENSINEMINYTDTDPDSNETVVEESECKLKTLVKKEPYEKGRLWTLGWRDKLCRCIKCREMYTNLNVSFLLDKDDEVRRYFTPSEDEDEERTKICSAVMKFEDWLLKMDSKEREELFDAGPEAVKQKMKDYFAEVKSPEDDFEFDDETLDHLFLAFKEFILESEDGLDFLSDMNVLQNLPSTISKGSQVLAESEKDIMATQEGASTEAPEVPSVDDKTNNC